MKCNKYDKIRFLDYQKMLTGTICLSNHKEICMLLISRQYSEFSFPSIINLPKTYYSNFFKVMDNNICFLKIFPCTMFLYKVKYRKNLYTFSKKISPKFI